MKKIDSDALGILNKSLGLSGAGSPLTELSDGVVDQVVSVNEIARRGRTQAGTEGIYTAVLQTEHAISEPQQATVDPYNVGTGVIAPYPDPMPPQFDIWLLGASVTRISGTGTIAAYLSHTYGTGQQGWGVNDSGAAIIALPEFIFMVWDTLVQIAGTDFAFANASDATYAKIGFRLPRARNSLLTFAVFSGAAATYRCQLVLGVFPVSLGQDGLV